MNPYFITQIDWNDDGDFLDSQEDVSLLVRAIPGISLSRGNDQLQDLSPPMAAQHSFDLDNKAKTFSPENAGSSIYSYLHPGHLARVKIDQWKIIVNYTTASNLDTILLRPTILAPTTYVLVAGDVLVYDILWGTSTDYLALDLYNGVNYLFNGLGGFVDQANITADPKTGNISSKSLNQFYTRYINLSSRAGDTVYPVINAWNNPASIHTTTSYIQNAYIINGSTIKFIICRAFETMAFTTISSTNANITGTDLAQHYYLGYGYVDDLKQNSAPENKSVSIPSLGTLSRLKGQLISTQLYSSITTDQALTYLCNAAGIPAGLQNFDTGNTVLDWWWLNNQDAFQAAVDVLTSEGPGAKLFEDARGRITFHSRTRRLTNTLSTVSNASFINTGTPPVIIRPYKYNPGLKDIVNVATATVVTRTQAGSLSVVWTYGATTITLAANQVYSIIASGSDPFNTATVPVAGTDYTLISGSISSITLDKTSGQNVIITITAGASGASLNNLQLRAKSVPITTSNILSQTLDTSVSQSKYGIKSFVDNIRQEINVNSVQDLLNGIVAIYQNPRPTISITVINNNFAVYTQQLNREISDRISINEPQSAFNGDVYIEYINHSIQKSGQSFSTQYGTEKIWTIPYAVWDSALWDFSAFGF